MYNTINKIEDADRYLTTYHKNTKLVKYHGKNGNGYTFVNPPQNISNCKWLFKSVDKAMNFLFYHENQEDKFI
jgi:hypothetical protein